MTESTMTLTHAVKATERSLLFNALRASVRVGAAVAPSRTAESIARRFFTTARPELQRRRFRGHQPQVNVLRVPDGKVTTYRWGAVGHSPSVLLTHGWNGWAQQMEAFVAPLLDRGFAVLAFDHHAHGLSDGGRTSLPAMIRTTEQMAQTPNLVGAIGHSLGAAALASVLATSRIELAGAVLVAPPSDPRPYLLGMARMLGAPERLLPEIQQHAEEIAGVPFDRLVLHPWQARRIRTPLLIAHDVDDREVPIAQGYAYTMGTRARLIATDGLGHTRILRDRHVVDSAVAFVTRGVTTGASGEIAEIVQTDKVALAA
jgi:pimeloyl-ACP methyl ester carboxylesterase